MKSRMLMEHYDVECIRVRDFSDVTEAAAAGTYTVVCRTNTNQRETK